MALIFDFTECSLCGKVLGKEAAIVAFPAFLRPDHELYQFSDSAFHESCFENCKDRDAVVAVYERSQKIWDSRPKDTTSDEERLAWARAAFADFR